MVHCRREAYDVYIGRPGPWGNPYRIGPGVSREEAVRRYTNAVLNDSAAWARWVREHVHELRGKVLGCWCKSRPGVLCHGDVLARLAEDELVVTLPGQGPLPLLSEVSG